MEFDKREEEGFFEHEEIEIYSKNAILGFSLFFSPLFGAIMLMINLRSIGLKAAGYGVIVFSIIYEIVVGQLLFNVNRQLKPNEYVFIIEGALLNVIGALILVKYFYKKYFPEENYYPKSISKPLMVAFILFLVELLLGRAGLVPQL